MSSRRTAGTCLFVAAVACLLLPSNTVRPTAAAQTDTPYEVVSTPNVMVAARDGVRLATDVFVPGRGGQATGRFPTIVERTPYNKNGNAENLVRYFVPRGFAVVVQDIRGRYRSEGRWRPLRDDGPDGADLLKWICAQPWSSGKVGTVGTSYSGGTQHALAIANAPCLSAMVPVDAMTNMGRFGVRHNGAFELRWFNWAFTLGNATGPRVTPPGVLPMPNDELASARAASSPEAAAALKQVALEIRDYVRALPIQPGTTPLKFAPDYESWLVEAMRHGDNDVYWTDSGSSTVDHLAQYQDVPTYHVTGWYDSWGGSVANLSYVQLSKAKKNVQRLLVGPWTHGGQSQSNAGIAEFGESARVDMNALRQRWFERWLLERQNGVEREAPVRIFVMGGPGDGTARKTPEGRLFVGGAWRDEREWPLARAVNTPYYLEAGGTLSAARPSLTAPTALRTPAALTRYTFDPRNPVPTIGGNISSAGDLMTAGARDQRCATTFWLCKDSLPLSARQDVLVFQTPVLDRDIEVTGPLVVKLWASSDAPDTDFTAKLVDVYPPSPDFPSGVDLNIGDSIVRARYRDSLKTAKMLARGVPAEFTIEMYPTSLVFKRGHRIRVDISSSNFPRFDINPNTGEPLNQNRRWRIAENTIHHSAQYPSRIILPVVPH